MLNLSQNFDVHVDSTKLKHIHTHSPQYHASHHHSILHPHNLNFKDVYLVCTILLRLLPNSTPTTRLSQHSIALPYSDLQIYTSGQARTTYDLHAIHSPLGLDVWPATTFGFSSETSLLC